MRLIWALIACAALWAYLFSPLGLAVFPTADSGQLLLTGKTLFGWPWGRGEDAFRVMPAVPFVFWFGTKLGLGAWFGTALALRMMSAFALIAWAWVLAEFALWTTRKVFKASSFAPILATAVFAAGLLDPAIRWAVLAARPEIWIALTWMLVLRDWASNTAHLHSRVSSRTSWKIALALALGFYFSISAFFMIPALAAGLWPWGRKRMVVELKEWFKRVFSVSWRFVALMLPYLILAWYMAPSSWDQLGTQWQSLWITSHPEYTWKDLPHLLFPPPGDRLTLPGFFVVAKVIFWILILTLTNRTTFLLLAKRFKVSRYSSPELVHLVGPTLGAGVAFWVSLIMWIKAPGPASSALAHLLFWIWIVLVLAVELRLEGKKRVASAIGGLAGIYTLLALVGASLLARDSAAFHYHWSAYDRWIGCLDRSIQLGSDREGGEMRKIWQPAGPDALAELATLYPQFFFYKELRWDKTREMDAIIVSSSVTTQELTPYYEGPERPEDLERMKDTTETPFGLWIAERLPLEQPDQWKRQVCQAGPFWANVAIRVHRRK